MASCPRKSRCYAPSTRRRKARATSAPPSSVPPGPLPSTAATSCSAPCPPRPRTHPSSFGPKVPSNIIPTCVAPTSTPGTSPSVRPSDSPTSKPSRSLSSGERPNPSSGPATRASPSKVFSSSLPTSTPPGSIRSSSITTSATARRSSTTACPRLSARSATSTPSPATAISSLCPTSATPTDIPANRPTTASFRVSTRWRAWASSIVVTSAPADTAGVAIRAPTSPRAPIALQPSRAELPWSICSAPTAASAGVPAWHAVSSTNTPRAASAPRCGNIPRSMPKTVRCSAWTRSTPPSSSCTTTRTDTCRGTRASRCSWPSSASASLPGSSTTPANPTGLSAWPTARTGASA